MHLRVALVVVLVGIAGALLPEAAQALYTGPSEWDVAAATVGYPLWRPSETLGLGTGKVTILPCDGRHVTVGAAWSARGGKRLAIHEAYPRPCGDAGEGRLLRTVRVGSTRVRVQVGCGADRRCRVTEADGPGNGFHLSLRPAGAKRPFVEVEGTRLKLAALLRVVRSLARVPSDGDVVQADELLSPDRRVWCVIQPGVQTWCETKDKPAYGATLKRDGTLKLCVAQPLCTQNWGTGVRVLRAGQRSELGGFACAAGADAAIACTVTATGAGFIVGATQSRAVGPAAVAPSSATASSRAAAPRLRHHVQTASGGGVRAEFSYDGELPLVQHGRLRIFRGGRRIVDRATPALLGPGFDGRGRPRRAVAVRALDAAGPPEVLLTLFTGGTHCCWESWIYSGTRRVHRSWGDIPPVLRDGDGDGLPELHGADVRMGYVFGPFAAVAYPARIWRYAGGALTDVTKVAAFAGEVRADQERWRQVYATARDAREASGVRYALAAYAADGYTLGQGDAAMAVVQAAVAAGEADTDRDDPNGSWQPDYLGRLRALLDRLGYA